MTAPAQQPNLFQAINRLWPVGLDLIWLRERDKAPVQHQWTTQDRKTLSELKQSWRQGYNLGIRLGVRSVLREGVCCVGVDMDVRSDEARHFQEAYAAVEELLEDPGQYPTVLSGRGNGSRHYYAAVEIERLPHTCHFRRSKDTVYDPARKKRVPAWEVDIGSTGRQFVAPGSVHPSGGVYTETVPLDHIPDVPEAFYEALETVPETEIHRAVVIPISAADVDLDALPLPEGIKEKIKSGPAPEDAGRWPSRSEYFFAMLCALAAAGLDDETMCSVATCPAYAMSGKPLGNRKGIRASAMQWVARQIPRARAQAERWRLENRLDVDLSDPANNPGIDEFFDPENIAEMNRQKKYEVVPEAPAQHRPFPCETLNEVAAWLQAEAPEICWQTGQLAAIALASAAASRRYRTEFGDPLNLYTGIVTNSIGLVRHYKPALHRALAEAGCAGMIANGRFSSPGVLYNMLHRSPALLYVSDDYGSQLAFAKRQPSGAHEQTLSIFADIHNAKPIYLNNGQEAGIGKQGERVVIHHPALSILAMISADQLSTVVRASELGRGALEQFLFVLAPEDPAAYTMNDPEPGDVPGWITAHIQAIRLVEQGDDTDLVKDNPAQEPDLRTVRFDAKLDAAYAALMAISDRREARPILLSARAILRRLCAVLAVWANPPHPVVSREILAWASDYVAANVRAFLEAFNILSTDDGKLTQYQQILDYIAQGGAEGRTPKDLSQRCWAFKKLSKEKRAETMDLLVEDGEVAQLPRGRGGKLYVAARFVKEAGAVEAFAEEAGDGGEAA
ncbi:bifunctional DNA primase/polymerase [Methylomagnum ishizawai]|uniref:bifunctional DNA primase/polymerase n=1 Tax=Methylomagnum ishizawai TaxID=1760988 RepID=UPI001C325074|nr:bifunctional DNA primase/polymerase [Methylomagnum ishizawai]BBL75457.1 hypothetical protein MishRS11D_25550 [Methylomagnum ishizawai]